MSLIFSVFTIARQIEGEYIFVKAEQGFKTIEEANVLVEDLKKNYVKDGKAVTINLSTLHGDIPCHCEIGVFELNVKD